MPASEDKSGVVWLHLILCSSPMLFCVKEVLAVHHGSTLGFITIAALFVTLECRASGAA